MAIWERLNWLFLFSEYQIFKIYKMVPLIYYCHYNCAFPICALRSVNCTVYFLGGSCTYTLSRQSHKRPHTSLLKQRLTWESVKVVTLSSGGKLLPTDLLPKVSAFFLLTSASKHVSGDEEKEQSLGACSWEAVVEGELQREVMRGQLGLAPLSPWDTGEACPEQTAVGNVGQAAPWHWMSLVPARWDWRRTTSRFSAPFTHKKYDGIYNFFYLKICNKRSQFFPLSAQERWDEKHWFCAVIQVEERKRNEGS